MTRRCGERPCRHECRFTASTCICDLGEAPVQRLGHAGRVHVDAQGTLFNIQAPSLAAYVPAYTLMTLDGSEYIDFAPGAAADGGMVRRALWSADGDASSYGYGVVRENEALWNWLPRTIARLAGLIA